MMCNGSPYICRHSTSLRQTAKSSIKEFGSKMLYPRFQFRKFRNLFFFFFTFQFQIEDLQYLWVILTGFGFAL